MPIFPESSGKIRTAFDHLLFHLKEQPDEVRRALDKHNYFRSTTGEERQAARDAGELFVREVTGFLLQPPVFQAMALNLYEEAVFRNFVRGMEQGQVEDAGISYIRWGKVPGYIQRLSTSSDTCFTAFAYTWDTGHQYPAGFNFIGFDSGSQLPGSYSFMVLPERADGIAFPAETPVTAYAGGQRVDTTHQVRLGNGTYELKDQYRFLGSFTGGPGGAVPYSIYGRSRSRLTPLGGQSEAPSSLGMAQIAGI